MDELSIDILLSPIDSIIFTDCGIEFDYTYPEPEYKPSIEMEHITDREKLKFDLSKSMCCDTNDFYKSFEKVHSMKIPIINFNNEIAIMSISDIMYNLSKNMEICNAGLIYCWKYRNKQCYAVLDWTGVWCLYIVAPNIKENFRALSLYGSYIYFLKWDDENNIYKFMIDDLPLCYKNENVFRDLSYCVNHINDIVNKYLNNSLPV